MAHLEEQPPQPLASERLLVDYAKSLDCIHCGLCLQTCPTFRLTGAESSSPRGRIHLMRAVGEGRLTLDAGYTEELDFCLLCRHCETVCPAGVRFGEMMSFARSRRESHSPRPFLARVARFVGLRVLLPNRIALRLMGTCLRFLQLTGLERIAVHFGRLGRGLADLPRIPPLPARRLLPARIEASGEERAQVALLEGCVMPELYARVNRATARSLALLGFTSHLPSNFVCCGSLHAHNGDHAGAKSAARKMIQAFEELGDGTLSIVVNSAGCGAHMRSCAHLFDTEDPWHARARAFEKRVIDYSEFVDRELQNREVQLTAPALPQPVAWDDPCHLCHGQGIRSQPRSILARVQGLEQVQLSEPEACCGSAGTYSLTHPEESRAIFERKLEDLEASGARTLITANPGCQLQWESGIRRVGKDTAVIHLAELVQAALLEKKS